MTDLYLIAHKVRGEPAFDVATQVTCPMCVDGQVVAANKDTLVECHECDGLGYWWIISTSGHRAYPWWHMSLYDFSFNEGIPGAFYEMPEGLPDHYTTRAQPTVGLAEALGFTTKPAPAAPIKRRF